MASVGFGSTVAAVAPASSSAAAARRRPRRSVLAVPAATRGSPAPAKEEKSLVDFIFSSIFKKDQLVETDPLLNKVDGAPAAASRAKPRGGTTSGGKKPASSSDDGGSGGGFNLGGLFAKKD
ncbi:hypothetical protein SEVIR_9G027700v4 [Setaria viridis]|uniref:Uncharacterized protein n=1 Tax=Setaria viridis TaxID=4556 RepID=A0A4U6SQI9_SETVI|nr:uncharacterized protein LOC117836019 [Setaria viridis]TKV90421.1 hypothetical protein SEVIR_9G027700v2 [Setaria viridis]